MSTMFRRALTQLTAKVKRLPTSSSGGGQPFSTGPAQHSKAQIEHMVQQARSALPTEVYKTIKEKPAEQQQAEDAVIRRDQLIWLARQSLADGGVAKKMPLSPHSQPWGPSPAQRGQEQDGAKEDGSGVVIPSVWPHLW